MIVTDDVIRQLETLVPLAPLHELHNIAGIKAACEAWPDVPQIACFDTAFHRSHPFVNDVFAMPRKYYDEGVRRYGFHGLSYEYVSTKLRQISPLHAQGRVVVAHLGNGASMCAILDGLSVASSMGFTPLDGPPMGTRCGQLDPEVLLYLMQEKKMSADAIADLLYRESGLKGLSGISNDMRELEESDRPEAQQAIDYFVFRIRRELGRASGGARGARRIGLLWRDRRTRVARARAGVGRHEVDRNRTGSHRQPRKRGGHLIGALARARVRDSHG